MLLVRRLYIYFVSAVSLSVLAVGLANLLDLALGQIWIALSGSSTILGDAEFVRRQVSLYSALVLVALPIWLLHWWLAERAVPRTVSDDDAERDSTVRALYLTLTLVVTLLFWALTGADIIDRVLLRLFGQAVFPGLADDMTTSLAIFLVAGGLWAYHARIRLRDLHIGPDAPRSYSITAFYVYAAAFGGAIAMAIGAAELIRLPLDAFLSAGFVLISDAWADAALASAISVTIAGFAVWGIHWGWSLGLIDRDDPVATVERRSTLRRLFLYLMVLTGVFVVLRGLGQSLETLFRRLLDTPASTVVESFTLQLVEPILAALPFLLLWIYGRTRIMAEAARYAEAPLQASVRRLYTYTVALVGLAFAAVGLAVLLSVVFEVLIGETRIISGAADWWRGQVAQFSALILVGAAAWIWHWQSVQRQMAIDPVEERGATTRRAYLYLILAGSLVAILASLAVVLYELLSLLLGVGSSEGLIAELSGPASAVIVAGILLVSHGLILRRDLALRPSRETSDRRMTLILSGPAGAGESDLDDILARLRVHLPDGYGLWSERDNRVSPFIRSEAAGPAGPVGEPEGQRG